MRTILFIFISCSFFSISQACTCYPPAISNAYNSSEVIFIGKYIESKYSDIGNSYGYPYYIDNFEVYRYFKGYDINLVLKANQRISRDKVIVSLNSNCNNGNESGCGICFTKDSYYIVYAYKGYNNGLITTDACTPTKKILKDEIDAYLKNDTSISELNILYNLQKADTIFHGQIETQNYVKIERLSEIMEMLNFETKKKNIYLCVSILLFFLSIIMQFKKRK